MVLDVRNLNKKNNPTLSTPVSSTPAAEPPQEPVAPSEKKVSGLTVGLEALVERAACASLEERLGAVEELRQLVPNQNGIDLLWQIVEDQVNDGRRLVAAQLLAYHGHRRNAASIQNKLVERLDNEKDPQILQALVRAVRQHPSVQGFLLAAHEGVAIEAALAVPLIDKTLKTVVEAVCKGHEEVARILLERLSKLPVALVQEVCLYLINLDWSAAISRLEALLARLPQVQLFMLFVEHKGMPQWEEIEEGQLRQINLVEQVANQLLRVRPRTDLMRYLLQRGSEDPVFARRHAPLVRQSLHEADALSSAELLKQLERLTQSASDDKLDHLAQVLVELSSRLKGGAADQAAALLEDLKNRSPGLKLKIYHLQQGWA
jgi:hypothetical protein